jgi:hypothetical protein
MHTYFLGRGWGKGSPNNEGFGKLPTQTPPAKAISSLGKENLAWRNIDADIVVAPRPYDR